MNKNPIIIVVGNEKGGAGKTTTAMHLIASLLYLDFKVASIDVDARQGSLTSYVLNRVKYNETSGCTVPLPTHYRLELSSHVALNDIQMDEERQLSQILAQERNSNDFIVIDTPGANNYISQLAHSHADIVITPINDSFVDLDLLVQVDHKNLTVIKPGIYSQMVWEQKINKLKRDNKALTWLIMRNRMSAVDAHNKRNVETVVAQLSKRLGCKIAPGFGERVIFRELFLSGLTLLDVKNAEVKMNLTTSHVLARQELLGLLRSLNVHQIDEALSATVL
jgi:chromosome partitioning protein